MEGDIIVRSQMPIENVVVRMSKIVSKERRLSCS